MLPQCGVSRKRLPSKSIRLQNKSKQIQHPVLDNTPSSHAQSWLHGYDYALRRAKDAFSEVEPATQLLLQIVHPRINATLR